MCLLSFLIGLLIRYKATPPQSVWVLLGQQEHSVLEWQADLPFNLTWEVFTHFTPPIMFSFGLACHDPVQ